MEEEKFKLFKKKEDGSLEYIKGSFSKKNLKKLFKPNRETFYAVIIIVLGLLYMRDVSVSQDVVNDPCNYCPGYVNVHYNISVENETSYYIQSNILKNQRDEPRLYNTQGS